MEYNTDYFYYSRPDGRFYKIRLLAVDLDTYTFQIIAMVHNGWSDSSMEAMAGGSIFIKHKYLISEIYDKLEHLLIHKMVGLAISGPYFKNEVQKTFYKELESLFTEYPEQYIKFVDKDLINTINYQFNIL